MDKGQLTKLIAQQARMVTEFRINSFEITNIYESENFASVSYRYTFTAKAGTTNVSGSITAAHSILEKYRDGWRILFEAGTQ